MNKGRVCDILGLVFVAGCLAARSTSGQGTIALHSGSANPATEGFTLLEGQPASVGPVFNDSGVNAWQTYSDRTQSQSAEAWYQQIFTAQQSTGINESDWVLTISARTVLNSSSPNLVILNTGTELFQLGFNNFSSDNMVSVQGSSIQTLQLSGGGFSYHTYQLDYHIGTDSAVLYVDGVEMLQNITGQPAGLIGNGALTWGEIRSGREANWNLVSFATVPEPSSFRLVFLSGLCGLFYVRLKHFKSAKGKNI